MSYQRTDWEFFDPTLDEDWWENFTLPSLKTASFLTLIGFIVSCSLCIAHFLTQRERGMHKGTSKGFERVSNVENGGAAADDEYDGDREEPQGKKPRYPAVDFFRGNCILYVLIFHLLWLFGDSGMLPRFPLRRTPTIPLSNYLYFGMIYLMSNTWIHLSSTFHPYISYFTYSIATILCIYVLCWESEISGVCQIMLCVGLSLAIVHEDRIKWRNLIIRTLKLGVAAGTISALTYIFMPRSPIYFGAIHCITLNTLLTMIFIRVPRIALVGFVSIQFFTMMGGVFPLEIPMDRPTVDVIPWFHNLGYCLLGVWLHSVGAHKILAIELIPGRSVHFEDTVFTFFGRHSLTVYLAHMLPVLFILGVFVYSRY